jgi:probable DNA repair protein
VNIQELFEKIKGGALVCVSNERLKRHISSGYDSMMLGRGLKAWKTPGVIELGSWLTALLTEEATVSLTSALLTKERASVLFEEAISADAKLTKELISRGQVARDSFEAYLLLKEYMAELSKDNFYLTKEALALKRWSSTYESLLEEKGFLCPSTGPFMVAERIKSREIKVEGEVIFAGFEDISPALSLLADALEATGVSLTYWPRDLHGEELNVKGVELYAYPDIREEVTRAAGWARENGSLGKKTGIIVPKLAQYKELIEREFSSELSPASALLEGAGTIIETFNISMAAPLLESPLVKSALDLVAITEPFKQVETELMWEILRSPYLHASKDEYFSLAAVDAKFRRYNRSELSLNSFSKELENDDWTVLKGFKERLDIFIKALEKKTNGRVEEMPSEWAGRLFSELKEFGWPGNIAELTSREFQAFEAFNDLLADFSALDDITGPLKRREAAGSLLSMAGVRTHQPKSPDTLVQVIGLGESIGFDFDVVRILGASGDELPPQVNPNPFIPIEMQRELGLTLASPELQSGRARERITRLINGAEKVVVTYPEISEGREVRVSPFFPALSIEEDAKERESNRIKDRVQASVMLEGMGIDAVVDFIPGEMEGLKGGTSILKNQSACPFKAFATHRLAARALESPEPGLSYADRGTIVHSALKYFWEATGDSEGLGKLIHAGKLVGEVRKAVDKSLEPYRNRSYGEVNYLNLEMERLRKLLLDWLSFEATREPFEVESLEKVDKREVGGLDIEFRIDRVDSIGKLGHVVIDYKTGKCSRNDWLGERPKDPQLLFYNLFGPYEALSFASVKSAMCKLDGIAASPEMLPGNKGFEKDTKINKPLLEKGIKDYNDLTDSWREVVEVLASDFADGRALVDPNDWGDPKRQPACYYSHCDLMPLCRIFEAEVTPGVKR